MSGKKAIVVVDDDAIMVKILMNTLTNTFKDEFLYEPALSAAEAFAAINKLTDAGVKIALIITDWLMPEMKGDELVLKVHRSFPDIKAIMISGYASSDVINKITEKLNLSAFITKPWEAGYFISEISKCVK